MKSKRLSVTVMVEPELLAKIDQRCQDLLTNRSTYIRLLLARDFRHPQSAGDILNGHRSAAESVNQISSALNESAAGPPTAARPSTKPITYRR